MDTDSKILKKLATLDIKTVEEILKQVTTDEDNEINNKELENLYNIELIILTDVATKNGLSLDRLLYDLNTSYYKQHEKEKEFKHPSDLPSQDITPDNSDYYKNIPIEKQIIYNESLKEKILAELNEIKQLPENKLTELLKKLKT